VRPLLLLLLGNLHLLADILILFLLLLLLLLH
jgi:hypothetical protein